MKWKVNLKNYDLDEQGLKIARRVLFKSMLRFQELSKLYANTFTGDLKRSITLEPIRPDSNTYRVFSPLQYASAIEYGSRPHAVPYEPLKKWASRKLGDENAAYAIAQKIKKEGTNPHPFMRPAFDQVKNIELKKIARQEFQRSR